MINKFTIILILVISSEVIMTTFRLDGFSLTKITTIGLIWIAVGISIQKFFSNILVIRKKTSIFSFYMLLIVLVFFGISIIRSFFNLDVGITTTFGNIHTVLAFFLPLIVIFSFELIYLRNVHYVLKSLLKFGVVLFFIFIVTSNLNQLTTINNKITRLLLFPTFFLITSVSFEDGRNKVLVFLSAILIFYVGYISSVRTLILREILLFIALAVILFYQKYNFSWVKNFAFLIILIPFIILQKNINSENSFFEEVLSINENYDNVDTRTFLYNEVLKDLVENKQLLFGKGANGTYSSDYFYITKEDSSNRLSVEVGFLALTLKIGLIGTFAYLLLIITCIYNTFFKSRNYYSLAVGFMLLVYLILFFIQNSIQYSFVNVIIWFFIGTCLSKEVLSLTNMQVKKIIQ